jgi:SAM-dependent methyltransferase
VAGIDIDAKAIAHAAGTYCRANLFFAVGDALSLPFADEQFDVVVCSQVYEHVPDAQVMMAEIARVLRPGGVVYFAAGNRLMLNEPHYNLPFLSLLPRSLAHRYIRFMGKGDFYYEKHLSFWGLRKLVAGFAIVDYTLPILQNPERYGAEYMVPEGGLKQALAVFMAKYLYALVPGYIWVLQKR